MAIEKTHELTGSLTAASCPIINPELSHQERSTIRTDFGRLTGTYNAMIQPKKMS